MIWKGNFDANVGQKWGEQVQQPFSGLWFFICQFSLFILRCDRHNREYYMISRIKAILRSGMDKKLPATWKKVLENNVCRLIWNKKDALSEHSCSVVFIIGNMPAFSGLNEYPRIFFFHFFESNPSFFSGFFLIKYSGEYFDMFI